MIIKLNNFFLFFLLFSSVFAFAQTSEIQEKKSSKSVDINVSLGYAPLIPLFSANSSEGILNSEITNSILGTSFYPIGFTARVSVIPFKKPFGYFGVELSPFYHYMENDEDKYILHINIFGAALSLLYQKPFLEEKLFLNIRAGAGLGYYSNMYFDYKNGIQSENINVLCSLVQGGISGQYFVFKKAFIELGLDFKILFEQTTPTGYLSPVLTAGWRF